jgi:hypothetical protein
MLVSWKIEMQLDYLSTRSPHVDEILRVLRHHGIGQVHDLLVTTPAFIHHVIGHGLSNELGKCVKPALLVSAERIDRLLAVS